MLKQHLWAEGHPSHSGLLHIPFPSGLGRANINNSFLKTPTSAYTRKHHLAPPPPLHYAPLNAPQCAPQANFTAVPRNPTSAAPIHTGPRLRGYVSGDPDLLRLPAPPNPSFPCQTPQSKPMGGSSVCCVHSGADNNITTCWVFPPCAPFQYPRAPFNNSATQGGFPGSPPPPPRPSPFQRSRQNFASVPSAQSIHVVACFVLYTAFFVLPLLPPFVCCLLGPCITAGMYVHPETSIPWSGLDVSNRKPVSCGLFAFRDF